MRIVTRDPEVFELYFNNFEIAFSKSNPDAFNGVISMYYDLTTKRKQMKAPLYYVDLKLFACMIALSAGIPYNEETFRTKSSDYMIIIEWDTIEDIDEEMEKILISLSAE